MKSKLFLKSAFFFLTVLSFYTAYPATFTVTINGGNAAGTVNSLRWAINQANATPGADIIDFNLASGVMISEDGTGANINANMTITEAVTIDATINNMAAAWATNGSCGPVLMVRFNYDAGFDIAVPGVTIRGLAFDGGGWKTRFGTGATSGTVQGCFFGLDIAGTAKTATTPSGAVRIQGGASGITVGGNSCSTRNVFVGDNNGGVYLDNGDNNFIIGNYFNTNKNGLAWVDPGSPQYAIVVSNGSSGNYIGRNNPGEGNVVVNGEGQGAIRVETATTTTGNFFENNYIGLDATGNAAIPAASTCDHGILIDAAPGNTVRNCVIAGFEKNGIHIQSAGADNWTIVGCKIGTDRTGMVDLGNRERGIFGNNLYSGHVIGTLALADRNIISGNGNVEGDGIMYTAGCTNCTITNNYIGVDATGNACLPNSHDGIFIQAACTGTVISSNIVGCNGYANLGGRIHGIHFVNNTTHTITGNRIGVGASGAALGNHQDGVSCNNSTSFTISNNIIGYNNWGVFMQAGGGGHIIISNDIYNNGFQNTPGMTKTILNEGGGVCAQSGANANFIGRANAGEGNTIHGNKCGIHLRGDPGGSTGNFVYNNTIYANAAGNYTKFATDYSGTGITVSGGSNTQKIGGTAALQKNNIYDNASYGVLVDNSDFVEIRRNSIYCNGGTTTNKRDPLYAIRLINGANNSLTQASGAAPGPLNAAPVMTAATGIAIANVPTNDITAGDIVEVYYDNNCGCQLLTYLGDATAGGTFQWSFPGGSIPAGAFCTPGAALPGGGTCPPSGLNSVTATRTTSPGTATARTSEPMLCTPTVLPVDMISFTAKRYSEDAVILNWITAQEKNNERFDVFRSTDGQKFVKVGSVAGAGSTLIAQEYIFIDENLPEGTYYYMLVQVDTDGKQNSGKIVTVSLTDENSIEIIPTVVASGEPVKIINFTGVDIVKISVTDLSGKEIFSANNVQGMEYALSTAGLSTAVYLVTVQTPNEVFVKKILVK